MINFKQFYNIVEEGKGDAALKHLEHLEDELFNIKGATPRSGVDRAFHFLNGLINLLRGHSKEAVNITTKWDGAPAVIFGIDPADGKFFVGTKGVWNVEPKLVKSNADILELYPDKGEESYQGLRDKMSLCFNHLKKLNIKNVVHGDLLYTEGDIFEITPPDSGELHIGFRPNTITYMVPKNTDLANRMLRSKLGIVVHTEYFGDSLSEMKYTGPSFGYDASNLPKVSQVWVADALIRDMSGQLNMTEGETLHIEKEIADAYASYSRITDDVFAFLGSGELGAKFLGEIKTHINARLRQYGTEKSAADDKGEEYTSEPFERDSTVFVNTFMDRYLRERPFSKVAERLTVAEQFLQDNVESFKTLHSLYLKLLDIKMLIYDKLINLQSLSDIHPYKNQYNNSTGEWDVVQAKQEGIVAVDTIDGNQRAVKIVDRSKFSLDNFLSGKPGAPK